MDYHTADFDTDSYNGTGGFAAGAFCISNSIHNDWKCGAGGNADFSRADTVYHGSFHRELGRSLGGREVGISRSVGRAKVHSNGRYQWNYRRYQRSYFSTEQH